MPIRQSTFCRGPEAPVTGSDLACAWLRCTVADPPATITRPARQAASFAGFTFHMGATSRSLWPGGRPPRPPAVHSRRPRSGRISNSATPFFTDEMSKRQEAADGYACQHARLLPGLRRRGHHERRRQGGARTSSLLLSLRHTHGAGQRSTCERFGSDGKDPTTALRSRPMTSIMTALLPTNARRAASSITVSSTLPFTGKTCSTRRGTNDLPNFVDEDA